MKLKINCSHVRPRKKSGIAWLTSHDSSSNHIVLKPISNEFEYWLLIITSKWLWHPPQYPFEGTNKRRNFTYYIQTSHPLLCELQIFPQFSIIQPIQKPSITDRIILVLAICAYENPIAHNAHTHTVVEAYVSTSDMVGVTWTDSRHRTHAQTHQTDWTPSPYENHLCDLVFSKRLRRPV